jgi:hypothetical protein
MTTSNAELLGVIRPFKPVTTLALRGSLEGSPPPMLSAHSSPELRLEFGPVKATYHRQVTLVQVTSAAFRSRGLSFGYIRAVAILASDRRDTTG